MFVRNPNTISTRVKIFVPIKSMILLAVMSALSGSIFAQTQTTTDLGTGIVSMVATAKEEPAVAVPAADKPVSATTKTAPAPIGAGSDHGGYVLARGYFFSVHRSNGDPAVINAAAGGLTASVDNFDYGWKAAYKAEAGWNWSSGWGVRGSYFYTNQSAQEERTQTATAPFFISPRPLNNVFTGAPTVGTTARFRERIQFHVIDLEGTYKWHDPNWTVLVSGGLRIAPTRQTYTVEDIFAGAPENLAYVQERTGYGPTGAIDFRHRLGGSNWWWTAQGRVAALYGDIDERSTYVVPGFTQTATRTSSRSTWVFEGETGLEWSHKFNSGANEIFLNGSFVYHNWNDLINIMPTPAVGTSATALLDNPLLPPTRIGSISFVGGTFTVGFRF